VLGVPKDKPISMHDMGKKLEAREDLKDQLRLMFGVRKLKVFNPEVDYLKQLERLRRSAERSVAK